MTSIKAFVGSDKKDRIPNLTERIPRKVPKLGAVQGYELSEAELKEWFGVNPSRFSDLPARFVLPELDASWQYYSCYKVFGQLYVIEPLEWVPYVALADTQPKSSFVSTFKGVKTTVSSTEFKAKAFAEVTIEVGGGIGPVQASAKAGVDTSIETNVSKKVEESITTEGTSGSRPIHLVKVMPRLRCRIVKHQTFEVRYWNDDTQYLSFEPRFRAILENGKEKEPERKKWAAENEVTRQRMSAVDSLTMNPVFVRNDTDTQWYGRCFRVCPVPFFKDAKAKEPDWFTLASSWKWESMYLFESEWKDGPLPGEDDTVVLDVQGAAQSAFQPNATWITDEELPSK